MSAWRPPEPHLGLLQEELWPDRWRMLVACQLLNLTTRKQVDGVVWRLFELWPTPERLTGADPSALETVLHPLGMQRRRACGLIRFSREYLQSGWTDVRQLHGVGKYAADSDAIFQGGWRDVEPRDHALVAYHTHLRRLHGQAGSI